MSADPTPWRFRRLLTLYPAQWKAEHVSNGVHLMRRLPHGSVRT